MCYALLLASHPFRYSIPNYEIILNKNIKYIPSFRPIPCKFLWRESNDQFIAA